jgi:hypothetical protein
LVAKSDAQQLSRERKTVGHESFVTKTFDTATELWEALSPTKELFANPYEAIFRGQADARWPLIPSVLRANTSAAMFGQGDRQVAADEQVFFEAETLEMFAKFCDQSAVAVPGDSPQFRAETLNA